MALKHFLLYYFHWIQLVQPSCTSWDYFTIKFCTSCNLYSQFCTSCNLYKVAVQVATCTAELYKLQLVQNLNLYITYIYAFTPKNNSSRLWFTTLCTCTYWSSLHATIVNFLLVMTSYIYLARWTMIWMFRWKMYFNCLMYDINILDDLCKLSLPDLFQIIV